MVRALILAATVFLALPFTARANTEENAYALVKRGQLLAAALNRNLNSDDSLIQEVGALIKETQELISLSCSTESGSEKACYLVTTLQGELGDLFPSANRLNRGES